MMDMATWRRKVLAVIKDLGDAEYQNRVWVQGAGPEVDSLSEAYCRLFDDNDFDRFISKCEKEGALSGNQLGALKSLRDSLNAFQWDEKLPDGAIIKRLEWKEIRERAREALRLNESM
jgi:hypothetical protein